MLALPVWEGIPPSPRNHRVRTILKISLEGRLSERKRTWPYARSPSRSSMADRYPEVGMATGTSGSVTDPELEEVHLYRFPRQGMRGSRVSAEVDAILCPRYRPSPNHRLIICKKRTLAGDQLFHELGGLRSVGREASNFVQMPVIVEHIRKDHGVPGREAQLQCFLEAVFRRRLAGKTI